MDDKNGREQVFWHIAPKQADHVAELIHKAISYYLGGDLGQWYWTLTGLREIINFDLDEKERKLLDELELSTQSNLKKVETYNRFKDKGLKPPVELRRSKADFTTQVKKYQRQLFDYLKDIGYFPDKEDRTKLGF